MHGRPVTRNACPVNYRSVGRADAASAQNAAHRFPSQPRGPDDVPLKYALLGRSNHAPM